MYLPTNPNFDSSSSSSSLIVDFPLERNTVMTADAPPPAFAGSRPQSSRIRRRSGSSPSSPSNATKSVRFQPTTRIAVVQGLWQMTDAEIQASFLTREDRDANRADLRRAVKALRKNRSIRDADEMSFRGIEHLGSNDELDRLQFEKELAIDAVLSAQEAGMPSSDVARLSSLATQKALARARRNGALDAAEVTKDVRLSSVLSKTAVSRAMRNGALDADDVTKGPSRARWTERTLC